MERAVAAVYISIPNSLRTFKTRWAYFIGPPRPMVGSKSCLNSLHFIMAYRWGDDVMDTSIVVMGLISVDLKLCL